MYRFEIALVRLRWWWFDRWHRVEHDNYGYWGGP